MHLVSTAINQISWKLFRFAPHIFLLMSPLRNDSLHFSIVNQSQRRNDNRNKEKNHFLKSIEWWRASKFIRFFLQSHVFTTQKWNEKGENVIGIKYFYLFESKNKNQFNEIDAKVGRELCYLFARTSFCTPTVHSTDDEQQNEIEREKK